MSPKNCRESPDAETLQMRTAFVSPVDHAPLTFSDLDGALVSDDGSQRFSVIDDVPHLLKPERVSSIEEFARSYGAVRVAEGRGSKDADYYRSLPYVDVSDRLGDQWAVRAKTYELLKREIGASPLRVVDAGAGNCWLAARLVSQGHTVVALDVNVDWTDGLGAHIHYEHRFAVARAELEAMPLAAGSIDLVVFNASAHYLDLANVVSEAKRVLRPDGRIIIADSPLYADPSAGEAMVQEMADYITGLGVKPASYDGPGFITDDTLRASGVTWRRIAPEAGLLRRVRGRLASRRAGRELATMPLLIATVKTNASSGSR